MHHQGAQGIHFLGNREFEKRYGTQEEILKWYLGRVND